MFKKTNNLLQIMAILLTMAFLISSCGGSSDGDFVKTEKKEDKAPAASNNSNAASSGAAASGIAAAADPSISAEDGGAGFDEIALDNGWETNTDVTSLGSPDAVKGGSIVTVEAEFPAAYRYFGKNSNYAITRAIGALTYEGLLAFDLENSKYTPALATHWKISEDKKKYSFRIDPRARWSDGKPVTSEDVVATYDLLTDKGIEDTYYNLTWPEEYERPVAESKYIVSVVAKKDNWRSFLYYSGVPVMPAYHLSKIDGAGYLKKYQYQMLPGTGPYELDLAATKKGEIAVMKRRTDYWAEDHPANVGLNNFDEIKYVVVRDPKLQLEKFKKGEFDFYIVNRAQWWKEEISPEGNEDLKRGLIQRHKVYNFSAAGLSGLALNTTKHPFDDIRTREAMSLLFNFDQINEKLFFGEYQRIKSYFPNGVYQNPNNPVPQYDPEKAKKLLSEVGWTKKAGEKWLTKDGKTFSLELMSDKSLERIFIPYQQDLEKAGIELKFNTMDGNERFKKIQAKEYEISFMSWGGLDIPNPKSSMHSQFGTTKDNTNITGLANEKIDALLDVYDTEYDGAKRVEIIQEIDGIAVGEKHYVLGWGSPYAQRVSYWNKFNMPKSGFSYSGDYRDVFSMWWYDGAKEKKLEEAKKDKGIDLGILPEKIDFWNKQKELSTIK